MKIHYAVVWLPFIMACASISQIQSNAPLVPIQPESNIRPAIRTSVNQNVNISEYHSIAIVGITRHSIPTLETMLNEMRDAKAMHLLNLKLQRIRAAAEADSNGNPVLDEITKAASEFQEDLWNANMESLIKNEAAAELELNRLTYESYEYLFLEYGFDVIERDRIQEVLQELNLSESGLIDRESAIAAGKLLAAQAVCLIETYETVGESFKPPNPALSVTAESFKVIIVETGQIALTGMNQNTVNGRGLMFHALVEKILETHDNQSPPN